MRGKNTETRCYFGVAEQSRTGQRDEDVLVPHAVTVRRRVARLCGLGHRCVDGRQADRQARQRVLALLLFLLQLLMQDLMVLPLL